MNGILFKPDMIKAIREGRKTVTRRLSGLKEFNQELDKWFFIERKEGGIFLFGSNDGGKLIFKPRYQIGEVVYIKEAWQSLGTKEQTVYKLDGEAKLTWDINGKKGEEIVTKWRSLMFLPAKFARYFIQITDVRPERLWEITEEDAVKEGVENMGQISAVVMYAHLWNSINKKTMWGSNPWVWRYEFKRVAK